MVDLDGDCVLDCVIDGNRCSDWNNTGYGLIRMGDIYVYIICICMYMYSQARQLYAFNNH